MSRRAAPVPDRRTDVGGEAVPLSRRTGALVAVRVVLLLLLAGIAVDADPAQLGSLGTLAAVHVTLTGLLSAVVLTGRRRLAVVALGVAQLADVVVLSVLGAYAHGAATSALVLGAYLVAVSLLASFRTGVKLAVWTTLVALLVNAAQDARLLGGGAGEVPAWSAVALHQVLLWVLVLVTCSAAAVSERELRRRRVDAEALRVFATVLHQAEDPRQVGRRVAGFLAEELDASRVCVARRGVHGFEVVAGVGLFRPGSAVLPASLPQHGPASAVVDLVLSSRDRVLVLRLDPARDPWLCAVMPGARRLVALPLAVGGEEPVVVLLEHGRVGGRRVDRRFVASAEQAVATASLALSRAELLERARTAASTDALTGLANRRVFDDALRAMVHAQRSLGETGSLVLVDVDRFKSINDTYGHPTGDEVLRVLARTLRAVAPRSATVARYGGEEFAVLLPATGGVEAAAVAERCRAAVEVMDAAGLAVTASFGVASTPDDAVEAGALVTAADDALIRAKGGGRNRVETASVLSA